VKICLFDWVYRAHHLVYLRRFAEACCSDADVLIAAPDEAFENLRDLPVQRVSLGSPRPPVANWHPLSPERRTVLTQEAKLLRRVASSARPDHLVHLYADHVLPHLVRRSRFPVPVSVLLFYPRAHYPSAFGTRLGAGELARARARELVVTGWRRRSDAHALLTLDEEAARRWARGGGAPAYWIPEPPVDGFMDIDASVQRSGCVLYGALAERKGIDLLANAIALERSDFAVTIAGEVSPSFEPILEAHVELMRRSGARVDVRAYRHDEREGLRALAQARCAVLPYPRHDGMSRVLLEACTVGTPVIVHDRGLLGYLVRRHRLGRSVDCRDARALRRAILDFTEAECGDRYAESIADFASRFSPGRFRQAVLAPFAGRTTRTSITEIAFEGSRPSL
jgi:Glycosyl transferases group 1